MRYERKFRTTGFSPQQVRTLIKLHPAGFFEPYLPRRVNNLYFESTDMKRFIDNLDGERDRTKIRIRWYGDREGLVEKPFLEFKVKHGLLGYKKRYDLEPFTVGGGLDRLAFRKMLLKLDVPHDVALAMRSADIYLMNSYKRTYYLSRDGRFRLTMDTDQYFCDVHRLTNTLLPSTTYRDEIVLELKYDQDLDEEVHWITNNFPFRLTKNSKFATGVDRVCLW